MFNLLQTQTMAWEVTPTVLTAVFGSTILVVLLWGVHHRLIPHLRQSHSTFDLTTPLPLSNTVGPTPASINHYHLRSSLYSLPSNNYIDPRNSIADTELMSTRWSTSIHDLDPTPTSPRSIASPKSCRSRTEPRSPRSGTITPLNLRSPRPKSLMTVIAGSPGSMLPRSPCINFQDASRPGVLRSPRTPHAKATLPLRPEFRKRSHSDSLLERSHALLYGYDLGKRDTSIRTGFTAFTGSTLQGVATPNDVRERSRAAVYTANTSKVRSPLLR